MPPPATSPWSQGTSPSRDSRARLLPNRTQTGPHTTAPDVRVRRLERPLVAEQRPEVPVDHAHLDTEPAGHVVVRLPDLRRGPDQFGHPHIHHPFPEPVFTGPDQQRPVRLGTEVQIAGEVL